MSNELKALGQFILAQKQTIANKVHEDRMKDVVMSGEEERRFKEIEPQIINIRANFIALFGEALIHNDNRQQSYENIKKWAKETGMYIFKLGVPLNEALKDLSYYREYLWKAIKEELTGKDLSVATVFDVIFIVDRLLDRAVYYFSLTYVDSFQKTLESAKTSFLELSVPVVPLVPGVGVLPLIGNIDTERAQMLMEETLRQAGKLQLTHLVLDISGVVIVDTMVADQLFKVIDALSLIGVKTIITGIRPEVAQTIVSLGLDLSHLTVKANLHQAFKEIQLIKDM